MKTEFNSLTTTKIGNAAEEYAQKFLTKLGYKLYWQSGDCSHPYDGYGYSGATITNSVRNLFEVKAKFPSKDGLMSIHENDLEKYEELQILEGKQMVILYIDHKHKELNVTNCSKIRKYTVKRSWDNKECKWLIYFNSNAWQKKADVPAEVCNDMWENSKGIQYTYTGNK